MEHLVEIIQHHKLNMIEHRKVRCNIITHKMEICHSNRFHLQSRKTIVQWFRAMVIQPMAICHQINGIQRFVQVKKLNINVVIMNISLYFRMVHAIRTDTIIHLLSLIIINSKHNHQFYRNLQCNLVMVHLYMLIIMDLIHMAAWQSKISAENSPEIQILIFFVFFYSTNGNGHYTSQQMQQQQSPYMGVPGSGYNKNQYASGPHMQRAPIYDGTNRSKFIHLFDSHRQCSQKLPFLNVFSIHRQYATTSITRFSRKS